MATHSSILAWKILWTKDPGRIQSTGSQRVGLVQVRLSTCTCLGTTTTRGVIFCFSYSLQRRAKETVGGGFGGILWFPE